MRRANYTSLQLLRAARLLVAISVAAACLRSEGNAEPSLAELAATAVQSSTALDEKSRSEVVRAASEVILLEAHGRLLPKIAPSDVGQLYEKIAPGTEASVAIEKVVSTLPQADVLEFDGKRLRGGNFGYTDHVIGANGLPIGMDRQLPTLLVPIQREAAEAIAIAGEKYRATQEAALVGARTDRLHIVKVSPQLVEDGIILRPYAGRFDDWFFHLVQEGTAETALQFYSVLEGLPQRTFHPVTGLGGPETTPPVWFNLNDIFSEGAHDAVRKYRVAQSGVGANPFRAFAWRVIPFLKDGMPELRCGREFVLSRELISRVMQNRKRFTPAPVPPLFRDPSRFLGMLRSDVMPAANVRELRAEIESDLKLPEQSAEPATNEVLQHTGNLPVWEDPQQPVSAPQQPSIPATSQEPDSTPGTDQNQPAPAVEPKVARAQLARFHIAVLTPTVEEAEQYVQKMVESEEQLAANARNLNRTRLYLRAFGTLQTVIKPDSAVSGILEQIGQRLEELQQDCTELEQARSTALTQRARLRTELEQRLRNERTERLKALSTSSVAL